MKRDGLRAVPFSKQPEFTTGTLISDSGVLWISRGVAAPESDAFASPADAG